MNQGIIESEDMNSEGQQDDDEEFNMLENMGIKS
jgi:hypothetical protein